MRISFLILIIENRSSELFSCNFFMNYYFPFLSFFYEENGMESVQRRIYEFPLLFEQESIPLVSRKDSCEIKLSFEGTTVAIVFSFSSRNHLEEFKSVQSIKGNFIGGEMADDWDRKKTRSRACLECEMYSSSRLVLGETVTNVFTMLIGLLLSFFPFFFFLSFFQSLEGHYAHCFFFLFYFVTIVTFLICTRLSYKRTYIFIINITIHQGIFLIFFLSLCVHRKISKKSFSRKLFIISKSRGEYRGEIYRIFYHRNVTIVVLEISPRRFWFSLKIIFESIFFISGDREGQTFIDKIIIERNRILRIILLGGIDIAPHRLRRYLSSLIKLFFAERETDAKNGNYYGNYYLLSLVVYF